MKYLTREQVFAKVKEAGYLIFENDSKEFNLNIIAIRSKEAKLDAFGCQLMLAWKFKGEWHDVSYHITTYPGSYYLKDHLLNPEGCAILAPGQYRGVYGLRLHRGKYEALCQTYGEVKVFRDGDKDSVFDLKNSTLESGDFGINVHNSPDDMVTTKVGSYSAGCLVFSDDREFFSARDIWRKSRENFGNKFTLTLINE